MNGGRVIEDYPQDILDCAAKAERSLEGVSSAGGLRGDERALFAVIRALEVIGEAAKHVPEEFRGKHPHVAWRGMTGMRDKVVHEYFGVDAEVVWRTVREDLPPLREAIGRILADLRGREGEDAPGSR